MPEPLKEPFGYDKQKHIITGPHGLDDWDNGSYVDIEGDELAKIFNNIYAQGVAAGKLESKSVFEAGHDAGWEFGEGYKGSLDKEEAFQKFLDNLPKSI